MEVFSQGWICPWEMKLLLRKRDLKRFCRIRLHFQISLLNGIDAKEGALAGSILNSTLQFQTQVGACTLQVVGAQVPEGHRHTHTHTHTHTAAEVGVITVGPSR